MRRSRARWWSIALVVAVMTAGCVSVRDLPAPIDPPARGYAADIEHTVGEFTFAMGENEPKESLLDGELLGQEIVEAWQARGYVVGAEFIDPGDPFSGIARYQLTLSGHQHNDSSFWGEVLNALTLMLVPYWVTHDYDLHVVLEERPSGARYEASIQAHDETYVELFLLLALPIAGRGHDATMQRVADRLYDQLQRQGAFRSEPPPDPLQVRAPAPRYQGSSVNAAELDESKQSFRSVDSHGLDRRSRASAQ